MDLRCKRSADKKHTFALFLWCQISSFMQATKTCLMRFEFVNKCSGEWHTIKWVVLFEKCILIILDVFFCHSYYIQDHNCYIKMGMVLPVYNPNFFVDCIILLFSFSWSIANCQNPIVFMTVILCVLNNMKK